MKSSFLFIDETINKDVAFPLTSLTALLVPTEKYEEVRASFYDAIRSQFNPKDNVIVPNPPELHFNNFLPSSPDEDKFKILEALVQLIGRLNIQIFRVGYYSTPLLRSKFITDPYLIGLCWSGIISVTTASRKDRMLIPVLDAGFERSFQRVVDRVSQPSRTTDVIRHTSSASSLSVGYSEKLAEPMYIDSKYSAFVQLTDCIAGLRRVLDTATISGSAPESPYKQRMVSIAEKLNTNVAYEETIELKFEGVPQGPSLLEANDA